MNLKAVDHIAVICSDYQKSKSFYTNILGFTVINETYRKARDSYKLDLKLNDIQIELFSFRNPPKRVNNPEACGLRHIAFEVDDLKVTVDELKEKGVTCEEVRVDDLTTKKFTFFKDPDDLPIELYER